jgi:hypothetical protein
MDENRQFEAEKLNLVIEYCGKPDGLDYACEKLGLAVWKLATGMGDIKGRLADAYIEIAILQETDFPPELREPWKHIRSELTRGKLMYETRLKNGQLEEVSIGRLASTLRYMRKIRAQRIAEQICDLESRLKYYATSRNGS